MFMQSRFGDSIMEPSTPRSQRKISAEHQGTEVNENSLGLNITTPKSNYLMKTPRKTPRSCCKTPNSRLKTPSRHTPSGDRFIPSRQNINFDAAHFKLVNEGPNDNISPTKLEEERQFKENLDPGACNQKILSFKIKSPGCARGICISNFLCEMIISLQLLINY